MWYTRKCQLLKKLPHVCDALKNNAMYRELLPSVHNLLRFFLTVPVTSSTSERSFSALKRLFTYLRSSMTEIRLNNCLLLHIHRDITDSLDLTTAAKEFVDRHDRAKYFGTFWLIITVLHVCMNMHRLFSSS